MNKILTIAAMALMISACSNNEIEQTASQPDTKAEGIPFTATISIGESVMTRALTEDETNNQIVPTWAINDEVALIHDDIIDKMIVRSVNNGVATITGVITGSPANGADVTIIYPFSAVDETTKEVDNNLLIGQDGTLATIAEKYDVRKGTGTLNVGTTASLNGNVSLTNQFAIWKLTLKDGSGAALPAIQLDIMEVGNGNEGIASVTIDPSIAAANHGVVYVMFLAPVPPVVNVEATVGTVTYMTYRVILSRVTLEAGKFYRSTLTFSKLAGSISYTVTDVQKNFGDDAFTNSLTNTGDGTVTYESSNTAVAEVDVDGSVTIKGIGSTTITATVADSDNYAYATKTDEYTLTVKYSGTGNLAPMDNPENL